MFPARTVGLWTSDARQQSQPWVRGQKQDAPSSDAKLDQALGGGAIEHLAHVVFGGLPLELMGPDDRKSTGAVFRCCDQLARSDACDAEFHCAGEERRDLARGNRCP